MKTSDGVTWEAVHETGFLDPPTAGICWLETFRGNLYIGVWSALVGTQPSQLWVYKETVPQTPSIGRCAIAVAVTCIAVVATASRGRRRVRT